MDSVNHPENGSKAHLEKHVLKAQESGGPLGLGDPEDQSLRKVEKDVLIGMIIRDRTRDEKCNAEYNAFRACGKTTGLALVYKCRKESSLMQKCYEKWYHDQDFVNECTAQYLRQRTEFRKEGIRHKKTKPGPIPEDILNRYQSDKSASNSVPV